MSVVYVPSVNLIGRGCLETLNEHLSGLEKQRALIVTDQYLHSTRVVERVKKQLSARYIESVVFDQVKPNPTVKNVNDGLAMYHQYECDFIVSLGGGSPQDAAKGIGLLVTNEGSVKDFEGVNQTKHKAVPIVAVNTTAGTSAEYTINYVITDEEREVKMVMVDKNSLVAISVNDPELMVSKPKSLTAATGMDALTHAIEAIVTPAATTITDTTALKAVEIICEYLPRAVENGEDIEAREQMTYVMFLAGLAFNNAGLGYVHAMAHQLGGVYDLPHGVCNAMLLPIVERENAKRVPEKFPMIAKAMGMDTARKSDDVCAAYVIDKIKTLAEEVGIPKTLAELGVETIDVEKLSEFAMVDACAPGNPFTPTKEEVMDMFKEIL